MIKPNVLILMCDQMQARRMGFVDGIAHTPNLDALAAEGVHFSNAISVHGQCAPSRCAFTTGMSPHECNVMANFGFFGHCGHLTAKNRTFFQEFQENGYTTAKFGKSHLGSPLRLMGIDHGECLDGEFPEGKEPVSRIERREAMKAEEGVGSRPSKGAHDQYLEDGLAWLNTYQPADDPLFFMFDTNLPHPPFHWQEEWKDRFKPADMVLPKSFTEESFEGKPDFIRARAAKGHDVGDGEANLRTELAQYYTMISAVDRACGQIIDVFKAKGMWDNTIVLFLSDHGDMMGGHKLQFKGTYPYEELYKIPCILRLPSGMQRKRATIEEPVISTALPGALLDLAGIDPSPPFADSDVTRALQREAPTGEECVFFEHYAAWWGRHPFYGARTATMKYVRYYGDEDFEELYDLAADPHELHNLVDDPAYGEHRKDLSTRADAWWKGTGGRDADFYESDAFKSNLNA